MVHEVERPRAPVGDRDQRVEPMLAHHAVDQPPRQDAGVAEASRVLRVVAEGRLEPERAFEDPLVQPPELLLGMGLVEGGDLCEGANGRPRELREVPVDARLELVEHHRDVIADRLFDPAG